jgi:16S rRNA (guanine966-N2)-methyltransferase
VRIVGGEFGGRLLRAPADGTRPTQEKVRAAIFSSLAAFVPGTRVLDLFAGSGALGLEAWSRGAAHVEWVENAKPALQALKRNLADLRTPPPFRVRTADALRWLEGRPPAVPFDLVLADPPYQAAREGRWDERIAGLLAANGWLRSGGVFVYETEGSAPPPGLPDWTLLRDRRYGKTRLWIWQLSTPERAPSSGS